MLCRFKDIIRTCSQLTRNYGERTKTFDTSRYLLNGGRDKKDEKILKPEKVYKTVVSIV